jgi:hypothetical protein
LTTKIDCSRQYLDLLVCTDGGAQARKTSVKIPNTLLFIILLSQQYKI